MTATRHQTFMMLDHPQDSFALGQALGRVLRAGDIITLAGGLGAGKTSVARGVLAALSLNGEAPSPTYPIVIAYDSPPLTLPVLHVDLYRIEQPDELVELGLDEALEEGALLIEWPERLGRYGWPDTLAIRLEFVESGGRRAALTVPESWEDRWTRFQR